MRFFVFTLFFFAELASASAQSGQVLVCRSSDIAMNLYHLRQQGDEIAARKQMDDGIGSGNCFTTSAVSLTFVAAVEQNQVVMVHSTGEPNELWTLASMLPPGFVPGR